MKNQKNRGDRFLHLAPVVAASASFLVGILMPVEQKSSTPTRESSAYDNTNQSVLGQSLSPVLEQGNLDEQLVALATKSAEEERITKLGKTPVTFRGEIVNKVALTSDRKLIALTFDDGPWPEITNHVLYVLNKYDIKGTFFVLGQNVQRYPADLKKISKAGHAIGNHSWNHPYHYHNPTTASAQIDRTNALIYETTGVKTELFRPPGGSLTNGLADYARQQDKTVVQWSADPNDYNQSSPDAIVKKTLAQAKPGGIVLLHDGGGDRWPTLVALPYIIEALKKDGYEFVTVPELLAIKEAERYKLEDLTIAQAL
jgi:chitin deacetylase